MTSLPLSLALDCSHEKSPAGLLLHCTICAWAIVPADTFADEPQLSFNRDVRPIHSDKCYSCHGSDANHREAELRLDTREGAKQ